MIRTQLLLAAAAAALAASPLAARPMTATDMQTMHRLGAPEVSPRRPLCGVHHLDTDWDKNKRINTLYLLDLTQARRGAAAGHGRGEGP